MKNALRWSPLFAFTVFSAMIILSSIFVFLFVKKSFWAEMEIITTFAAVIIFLYFILVLYVGVRFDKKEKITLDIGKSPGIDSCISMLDPTTCSWPGIFSYSLGESGVLGLIAGIFLDILMALIISGLICFLLWLGLNIALLAVVVILTPLFYLFKRTLRYVATRGRHCKGNIRRAFIHSLIMTLICTGWFYAILLTAHLLSKINQ